MISLTSGVDFGFGFIFGVGFRFGFGIENLFLKLSWSVEFFLTTVISKLPNDILVYIIGDICETLNYENNTPKKISLLRLDTDWYQSTKKEMEVLYPKLVNNGVLIVDDYGHWKGSKKAVDEYLIDNKIQYKMEKIDYTGIKIIKNS